MLSAVLVLLVTEPAGPMLGELKDLSPAQVGERVLKGRQHDRIASFRLKAGGGMNAPGFTEYELVEAAQRSYDGCVRRRWTVEFSRPPGASDAALFQEPYSGEDIALPRDGNCEQASYAGVNTGLDWHKALKAMAVFQKIASAEIHVSFNCTNSVNDDLCVSREKTLEQLRTTPAWEVSQSSEGVELWLGHPRQTAVTIVKFDPAKPDLARLIHTVPESGLAAVA